MLNSLDLFALLGSLATYFSPLINMKITRFLSKTAASDSIVMQWQGRHPPKKAACCISDKAMSWH